MDTQDNYARFDQYEAEQARIERHRKHIAREWGETERAKRKATKDIEKKERGLI